MQTKVHKRIGFYHLCYQPIKKYEKTTFTNPNDVEDFVSDEPIDPLDSWYYHLQYHTPELKPCSFLIQITIKQNLKEINTTYPFTMQETFIINNMSSNYTSIKLITQAFYFSFFCPY